MMVMVLSVGTYTTIGIVLVEMMEVFEAPASIASLLVMCCGISYTVTALLLSTVLGGILHERGLVVIGTLLGAFAFFATSFSTRIEHVMALGFGVGAFTQIGYAVGLSVVGKYFKQRIGLATGLIMAGSSLGTLVLPPVIRFLLDEYAFRGTLMIESALLLNAFLCAALIRPVTAPSIKTTRKIIHADEDEGFEAVSPESIYTNQLSLLDTESIENNRTCSEERPGSVTITCLDENTLNVNGQFMGYINVGYEKPKFTSDEGHGKAESLAAGPEKPKNASNALDTGRVGIRLSSCPEAFGRNTDVAIVTRESTAVCRERNASLSNVDKQSTRSKTLLLQFCSDIHDFFVIKVTGPRRKTSVHVVFGLDLFKNPEFTLFQMFALSSSITSNSFIQFYPAIVKEAGIPDIQAALLLSIMGASDLITRVLQGWLGDWGLVERYKIVMISQFILGLALNLSFLAVNFWSHVIFSIVVGCLIGIYYTSRGVLVIELFGLDVLPKTIGVSLCVFGLGMISASPIVGWLRDLTGGYRIPLHILGSLCLFSGCMLGVIGIIRRAKSRKRDNYTMDPTS